jgi:hypothetical protein
MKRTATVFQSHTQFSASRLPETTCSALSILVLCETDIPPLGAHQRFIFSGPPSNHTLYERIPDFPGRVSNCKPVIVLQVCPAHMFSGLHSMLCSMTYLDTLHIIRTNHLQLSPTAKKPSIQQHRNDAASNYDKKHRWKDVRGGCR